MFTHKTLSRAPPCQNLGSRRIALRSDDDVTYLHADHLGSASLATDANGATLQDSNVRYLPFGEQRVAGAGMPTDRLYTGQRWDAGIGLYDYNARYYDPALGRFVQADTIVPEPGNPQALNRYAYVYNNPLKYTDPSGHLTDKQIAQTLGFDSVDHLHASRLWRKWNSNAYGDSYWIAVLRTLESGDRLYATERSGHLLFQEVDGVMRILAQGAAESENLWDWQGAGFYTLGRYEDERQNARLSDAVFSGTEGFRPLYLGFGDLDQALYCYDVGPQGGITAEYLGYRTIERNPGINPTSTIGFITGGHSGWKFGADMGITIAPKILPEVVMNVGGHAIPVIGTVKNVKLLVDVGLTVHKSIADPVYHYDTSNFSFSPE